MKANSHPIPGAMQPNNFKQEGNRKQMSTIVIVYMGLGLFLVGGAILAIFGGNDGD